MKPATAPGMKFLALALQGGGSHGAFTWGVLDALLADPRIAIEGLSGTSAGAVNAVALAAGWASAAAAGQDPRAGARETLARVWNEVAGWGALGVAQKTLGSILWGGLGAEFVPTNILMQALQGMVSPYQANPLDINPLRSLLDRLIDFEHLAHDDTPIKVFVSATHVQTGKAVVFSGRQLTAQAVTASACLPMLFQAVEIDGQHYWDGGYSVNPPLSPLIRACDSPDLLLVQINPLRRDTVPKTAGQIADRINELTFNASLLTQMRAVEAVNRLLEQGHLRGARKPVRLHRIDGGNEMQEYPASSKNSADAALIKQLFDLGQSAARRWLARHWDDLGQRTTVDVRRDYLDDTWQELPAAGTPAAEAKGWRPWLARLLRRSGHKGG